MGYTGDHAYSTFNGKGVRINGLRLPWPVVAGLFVLVSGVSSSAAIALYQVNKLAELPERVLVLETIHNIQNQDSVNKIRREILRELRQLRNPRKGIIDPRRRRNGN